MLKPLFFILFLFSFLLNSCSSFNKDKQNDFLWLKYQQKKINYFDTTEQNKKLTSHFIAGSVCQMQNNYAEAVLEFQSALRYDSSATIFYLIAKSYLALDKLDFAIKNALTALKYDKNFIPAYDILAESYLRKMDLQNAIFSLETAVKIEEDEKHLIALAKIYEYQNINKSLHYYTIATEKYNNSLINLRILELCRLTNDSTLYLKTLSKLAKNVSDNIVFTNELINYYIKHKLYDSLLAHCKFIDDHYSAVKLEYPYTMILNHFIRSKEVPNKIKFKFLDLIDNRFYFYWKLNFLSANIALSLSDTNLAAQYFNRVLTNTSSDYNLPLEIAASYLSYGFPDKYELKLLEFTNEDVENWIYPFYLSLYYFQNNNLENALFFSKLSLERNPEQIEILSHLATIYDALKKFDKADVYFKKALKLEPENPLVNNNYAYSLCVRNIDIEKALLYSEKAIKVSPNNSAYLDTYGWIHYHLGNYEVALEYILKSIELGEKSAEVFEHLADIYMKMGKYKEAKEAYTQALQLSPNNHNLIDKINKLNVKLNETNLLENKRKI